MFVETSFSLSFTPSLIFFSTICICINLTYVNCLSNFFLLQPLMLIVPDVQDVYTPLQTDLILPVSEVCICSS